MKPLSSVASNVQASTTLALDSLYKEMKANGVDVLGFAAGEPDFPTPDHIKLAAVEAIIHNETRYTPASGTMALKIAICDRLKADLGLHYEPPQIVCSSGAKHCVYIALRTLVDEGDEVIVPAPYWVSYVELVKMVGGTPVAVLATEEENFKLTPEKLEAAITPKTKCVMLNNPSNPTGMLYTREELKALAEVIVKHDLYVLADEIYYKLVYDGRKFVSIASLGEEIKKRSIIINGVSKSYAMTGWRLGYLACDAAIAKVASNYLSHSTGNPCSITQAAAAVALEADQQTAELYRGADQRHPRPELPQARGRLLCDAQHQAAAGQDHPRPCHQQRRRLQRRLPEGGSGLHRALHRLRHRRLPPLELRRLHEEHQEGSGPAGKIPGRVTACPK